MLIKSSSQTIQLELKRAEERGISHGFVTVITFFDKRAVAILKLNIVTVVQQLAARQWSVSNCDLTTVRAIVPLQLYVQLPIQVTQLYVKLYASNCDMTIA